MRKGTNVAQPPQRMNSQQVTAAALRHGVIAAQAREFERARELLQQVTEQTPDDVLGWYWLAIASPSADAAIPCLRRVLDIDQGHSLAREALSRVLIAEAKGAAHTREHRALAGPCRLCHHTGGPNRRAAPARGAVA
jgi:hypothetical protein